MVTANLLLMIISFVMLLLAGLKVTTSRVDLGWLGLSALVLAMLLK